ncbi:MAG: alpha/beta hydrolase-fold protein [Bacteroidota bacterium]
MSYTITKTLLLPIILLASMAALLNACQEVVPPSLDKQTLQFSSKLYQTDRTLYIQLPKDMKHNPKQKYPLLLVLDGDELFDYVASTAQLLADMGQIPHMVVVGISHQDRDGELLPNYTTLSSAKAEGRTFAQHLRKELLPYLEAQYPLIDHRTVIGHSFGGLWALYVLKEESDLFQYYIASDPSYRVYSKKMLRMAPVDSLPKRLYLGIADVTPYGIDTAVVTAHNEGDHTFHLLRLRDELLRHQGNPIHFAWKYYSGLRHAEVRVPIIPDGLQSVFSWYPIDEESVSFIRNPKLAKEDAIDYAKRYFDRFKKELGAKTKPEDLLMRRMAAEVQMADEKYASRLLQINARNHPHSFDAQQALGFSYLRQKKRFEAEEYLRKALQIKEDERTRAALNSL